MKKEENKLFKKNVLELFTIKLGIITQEEINERKKMGLPWNVKPKK